MLEIHADYEDDYIGFCYSFGSIYHKFINMNFRHDEFIAKPETFIPWLNFYFPGFVDICMNHDAKVSNQYGFWWNPRDKKIRIN